MDSVGLSGDESPGLLDLGVIRDPRELLQKAARRFRIPCPPFAAGKDTARVRDSFRSQYRVPLFADRSELSGMYRFLCSEKRGRVDRDGPLRLYAYLSTVNDRKVTVDYAVTGGTARGDGGTLS